jgi:hypothetical protein
LEKSNYKWGLGTNTNSNKIKSKNKKKRKWKKLIRKLMLKGMLKQKKWKNKY